MRAVLVILAGFVLPQVGVVAQVAQSTDVEWVPVCMVDSLPSGEGVRFQRTINMVTLQFIDIDPTSGSTYTPIGSILTCETWDVLQLRDPLDELYDDCQCIYTISQENHRVDTIRGGSIQEYDVTFQEVVRRRCADQQIGTVVHRDTLIATGDLDLQNRRLHYGLSPSAPGEVVNSIDLWVWSISGTQSVLTVDLDPATVQASYPGLTLDVNDFTYDGANLGDMAAAYALVMNHAVELAVGVPTNAITATSTGSSISLRTAYRHDPDFPYALLPDIQSPDYQVVRTFGHPIAYGVGGSTLTTRTTDYTEECSSIWNYMRENYVRYDYSTPLHLQPELELSPVIEAGPSNPTAFCDVSPAICAELTPDPVALDGCIETCSDVLNFAGHMPVDDDVVTLSANSYNSVSIYITQGPVQVTIDGVAINYPTGWSNSWGAAPNRLLSNSIRIDATGGEAIISYVK